MIKPTPVATEVPRKQKKPWNRSAIVVAAVIAIFAAAGLLLWLLSPAQQPVAVNSPPSAVTQPAAETSLEASPSDAKEGKCKEMIKNIAGLTMAACLLMATPTIAAETAPAPTAPVTQPPAPAAVPATVAATVTIKCGSIGGIEMTVAVDQLQKLIDSGKCNAPDTAQAPAQAAASTEPVGSFKGGGLEISNLTAGGINSILSNDKVVFDPSCACNRAVAAVPPPVKTKGKVVRNNPPSSTGGQCTLWVQSWERWGGETPLDRPVSVKVDGKQVTPWVHISGDGSIAVPCEMVNAGGGQICFGSGPGSESQLVDRAWLSQAKNVLQSGSKVLNPNKPIRYFKYGPNGT